MKGNPCNEERFKCQQGYDRVSEDCDQRDAARIYRKQLEAQCGEFGSLGGWTDSVGEGPEAASHTGSWGDPPGDPPEGHVEPQSWPLPPGQACAAP